MNIIILGDRKVHVGGDLGYPTLEDLGHNYVYLYHGEEYPSKSGVPLDSHALESQIQQLVSQHDIDILYFRADWFDVMFREEAGRIFSLDLGIPKVVGYHCHTAHPNEIEKLVFSHADGYVLLNQESLTHFSATYGILKPHFLMPSLLLPPKSWYECPKLPKRSAADGQIHCAIPSAAIRLSGPPIEKHPLVPIENYLYDRYDYSQIIQQLSHQNIHVHVYGRFVQFPSGYSSQVERIYRTFEAMGPYIHFEGTTSTEDFSTALSQYDFAILTGFYPRQIVPWFDHMNYQLRFNSVLAAGLPIFVAAGTSSALEREILASHAGFVFETFDDLKAEASDRNFMESATEAVFRLQERHSFEAWAAPLVQFFNQVKEDYRAKRLGPFNNAAVPLIGPRSSESACEGHLPTGDGASDAAATQPSSLALFSNKYAGKRAFIIGNGPSLKRTDLTKLKDEITFGVNSIFYLFDEMGFKPTFYVVEDTLVAEDRAAEINELTGMVKIFGNYLNYCLEDKDDVLWANVIFDYSGYRGFPHFSRDASECLWVGGTVSYLCMQLAYFMGFQEVYLIGFDHSYTIPDDAKVEGTIITSASDDPNHFHPGYFGKGKRWHDPRVDRMELAYRKAKQAFEADGRAIYNATSGGKLEVFPRVPYDSLFHTAFKKAPQKDTTSITRRASAPRVSVVVCTYQNPDSLRNTLDSLAQQTLEQDLFEVIVVDNNSNDRTRDVVASYSWVTYILEKQVGLSHARNAGLLAARADVVAFIDDDAEASKVWLESLLKVYDSVPDAWAVGGKVLPIWDAEKPKWLTKDYYRSLSLVEWGEESRPLHWPERIIGTNCSFKKRVFSEIGRFDTSLGRMGPVMLGNEDTEIQQRIHRSAHLVYYSPEAVVYHHVPASRMTKTYFRKRQEGTRVSQGILNLRFQKRDKEIEGITSEIRRKLKIGQSGLRPAKVLEASNKALEQYKDKHRDQRCVIIGNGPSLKKMDLSFLKDEITFGMNRIYLLFDQWQFTPTYYVSVNTLVLEQSIEEILKIPAPKFLNLYATQYIDNLSDPYGIICLRNLDAPSFAEDPRHGIWEGHTVTYVAMQLAYFMGFRDVILIGVDHHFVTKGPSNAEVVSEGDDPNHFHPAYFGKGTRWHLPDLKNSEIAYGLAKKAFEADGRRIIDATLDGKLTIFPKAAYRELFDQYRQMDLEKGGHLAETAFLNDLGEALFSKGDLDGAFDAFTKALKMAPNHATLHNNLGVWHLNRGDVEKALTYYEQALQLQPQNSTFQKNLADLYYLGLGRVEDAIQIYKEILASHPEDTETFLALGHICKTVNQPKEAVFFYERAIELEPKTIAHRDAVLNLGEIWRDLGELEKAREVYLSFLCKTVEDEDVTLAWSSLCDKEEDEEFVELVKGDQKDYLVSAIVSTYASEEFMAECLDNLEAQTISEQIEVVVIDAASPENEGRIVKDFQKRYSNITYVRTKGRIGIYTAWNLAAQMASGKYCMTVSTNDHLRKDACEVLVRALDANPDAMLVYGDTYLTKTPHETFDKNTHYGAYRWSDYSFEALLHNCMVGPHPMWRTSVHEEIGYFDDRYGTVADQEFWLRMGEKHKLLHIREVTGLQWITPDAISRKGALPSLEIAHIHGRYQKRHGQEVKATKKRCSVIIPAFNQLEYTKQCLEALFKNTPEEMYELIVVDNGSTDGTKEFLTTLRQRATVITNGENLGFARACNQGARAASGKYLLFLNNDTLPLPRWLEEMVEVAEKDETVGIVGSKLLFPDGTIQHAGVVVSANGLPYHLYRGCPGDMPCANQQRSFQIVTAACMLIGRDLFFETKGFNEGYVNGCEDIDLCLKVGESKRRVVYNPKSVLVHFEGKTEGRQDQMDHNKRLLLKTWGKKLRQDDVSYLQQDGMELRVDGAGDFRFEPSSRDGSPIKTSIIVVTYNSLADITKCIDSITRNTSFPYEIIVIDNVSSDGTQDYLKTLKDAKIILNSTNNGFSKGCNQGISKARGDYIVLLNPDTMVSKGWDAHLTAHFQDGVGAVGPVSNYVAGLQKVELYCDEKPSGQIHVNGLQDALYNRNRKRSVETKLLIGFCFMTKREVIDKVGMLDEDLFLGNDDLELSLRLRKNGYKLLVATDTFIYHKGQASFKSEPSEKTRRLVQESTDALYRKLQEQYGQDQVPSPQELWGIDWFKPSPEIGTRLTSIVILAYNQLAYTKKCISSIFKYTKKPFELIVVDNGSSDGTMQYLKRVSSQYSANDHKPLMHASGKKRRRKKGEKRSGEKKRSHNGACKAVKVIRNEENLGFAAGNNQGMAVARGDYVLLMNNDVVVTPGWLDRMISCAERSPNIGMVGPMSNYVSGPQLVKKVNYNTTTLARLNSFAKEFAEEYSDQSRFIWRVVGFCMLIKRVVIEKIGGMDGRYGLGNFEDDDFSLRAALAGFESWIAEDCFIHHFGSRTFIGAKIDYRKSLHKNWEIFKQKWGLPLELPYGSPYTISHVPNDGFDPTKHFVPIEDKESSRPQPEPAPHPLLGKDDDSPSRLQLHNIDSSITASIIIPVSKHQGHLKRAVESIQKHTSSPHEIIFFNNSPKSSVSKWLKRTLKENPRYRLVQGHKEASVARSYNEAMRASTGPNIVLLDSHVVVSDSWLSGILDCMSRVPNAGIVGPMTNKADGMQHVADARYESIENLDDFAKSFRTRNQYRRIPATRIDGFCMLFRRELLDKVGSFDESLKSGDSTIHDFCLRAALKGYTSLIAGDIFVHDDGGKSVMGDNKGLTEKWSGIDADHCLGKKLLTLNSVEKAWELSEKGELEMAVKMLVQGMRHAPNDKSVYFALAEILINDKQFKDALDVVHDIPSNQDDIRKMELIACCMEGMERYKEAEECVDRILSLDASSPFALNLRGLCASRQGDKDLAEEFFNSAIKSDPGYGRSYTNLGNLKWDMGRHEEALDFLEKGFILSPTVTDVVTTYHAAVTALVEFKRAEPVFKEAHALHPMNSRITHLLIDILIKQEKHDLAMKEIEGAIVAFGADDGFLSAALKVRGFLGPEQIHKPSKKKRTISLCMIVKNEEQHLARCLSSLKPVVDEIIVVDTGSTDRTKEIAAVFGAKVYDCEWSDDFSAARNASISKASGDWILVMDADEVISPLDHDSLRQLVKKSNSSPAAYSLVTRNYSTRTNTIGWAMNDGTYGKDEAGAGWMPSIKVRLFPNNSHIRFEYPVHERVEPSLKRAGVVVKRCSIPVHHYGQLDQEKRDCKGESYYELGMKKLSERGDDVEAIHELAVQAGSLGKHEEAIDLWQRLLALKPLWPIAFVNMGTAYLKLGQYEDALISARKAVELAPQMKEAVSNYALCELYVGNVTQTIAALEGLLKKESRYLSAQFILAVAYCCDGQIESGLKAFEELRRITTGPGLAAACYDMAKRFVSAKRNDYAIRLLEAAIEGKNINEDVVRLLDECRQMKPGPATPLYADAAACALGR
ncbi:MAG: glycosyltransferase [Thermodesulfobacteriota bacterium]|nr:glycosyltransferase [Thermodesulfobacteriota bacterium]